MKIGIIGAGAIGGTLAQRLATAGHDVSIANSRSPETMNPAIVRAGAHAVWAAEVTENADVVIVSVNLGQVPGVAELVRAAPSRSLVIDTSNYYPQRDGTVEALEPHAVESQWVAQQYGRPVAKAWNAITSASFADAAMPIASPNRIAIPVAADDETHRRTTMDLVEDTGFDPFDAGVLSESWRQQPGTPAYCTDLTRADLSGALAAADRTRSARRRDLVMSVVSERAEAEGSVRGDFLVALNRAVY